jgi:hypothetical protein
MRIYDIDENFASQLIKGATKLIKPAISNLGQTFNFAHQKPDIVNRISQSLKTGQPVDLNRPVYDVLRNSNATTIATVDQLGYTQAQKAAYKSALDNWPNNNGAWAQKNFGPARAASKAGDRTQNYYATIEKDRANLDKYMNSLPDLDKRIQQLAQQTAQPISYKTNANLTALAADNDNLKLFYYDPKLKPQIEATVKSWLQANGIRTGQRSHVHGVDIKGQGSYGEIIAKHANDSVNYMIKKYGTQYTPEQYYEWLGKNMRTMIDQISKSQKL